MPIRIHRDLFYGDIISLTDDELKIISGDIKLPDINSQIKDTSEKLNQHITDATLEMNDIKTNVAINYYTKKTVDDIVATVKKNTFSIVSELPETGEEGIIYLVKKGESNIHTQHIWEEGMYIDLGDTTLNLDNYYTKTVIDSKIAATEALISSEETKRTAADTALTNSLATEAADRKAADDSQVKSITDEISARKTGDSDTLTASEAYTDKETTRAKAAESTLTTNLNNEIIARQDADSAIKTLVNSEASKREAGDTDTLASAKSYADTQFVKTVTLADDQAIEGEKTFSKDITVPNIYQSTQSPEYSTFSSTCGITPRWFSTCGGDDGTFFVIDLSNTSFPFVDMFVGGNNETPTQKWAAIYDESGTLSYALNAVEMELRIHKHKIDQKYADVYITDHRDGKMVNDSVSGGYVVVYSTKNLMFEGYVGTSDNFYSTTKPSWFDASALSEKYNSRFVLKDDFDTLVARVAALENTADKEY